MDAIQHRTWHSNIPEDPSAAALSAYVTITPIQVTGRSRFINAGCGYRCNNQSHSMSAEADRVFCDRFWRYRGMGAGSIRTEESRSSYTSVCGCCNPLFILVTDRHTKRWHSEIPVKYTRGLLFFAPSRHRVFLVLFPIYTSHRHKLSLFKLVAIGFVHSGGSC